MNIEPKIINKTKEYWNRQILNFYWIIFILVITIITMHILDKQISDYDRLISINSGVILLLTLVSAEILVRNIKRYKEIIIITTGNIIAVSLCLNHYEISFEEILLIIPILASSIYFNIRYIYLATSISILTFMLLYFLNFNIQNKYDSIEVVVMISLFSFIGYLISMIVNKGVDIIDITQENIDKQEELFIKNVVIETSTKTDALTGLYNHITYQQFLTDLLMMADSDYISVHLAILDIDNFKSINDTFGHSFGDNVIRRLSEVMRQNTDDNAFLARYGGEELVIIFIDKKNNEVLDSLENIRKSLSFIKFTNNENEKITVSIGLKKYEKNSGKNVLFEEADRLLYKAKHSGKNCVIHDMEVEVTDSAK